MKVPLVGAGVSSSPSGRFRRCGLRIGLAEILSRRTRPWYLSGSGCEGGSMGDETIRCIRAGDRDLADPTPGMVREQAIAIDGLWSGYVRTDPGMVSGWHHHGDH